MEAGGAIKEYWPLFAAAGAVAVGFALSGVGATSTSGYKTVTPDNSAALKLSQAQLQAEVTQNQTIASTASAYLNYLSVNHQLDNQALASQEAMLVQEFGYSSQLSAIEASLQTQQQLSSDATSASWWKNLFATIQEYFKAAGQAAAASGG